MKKKILRLDLLQTNKTDFKGLFIFCSCCNGNGTYVNLAKKNRKFVLLTCVWPFLATKGSRVLEKKEIETQVSKLRSATLSGIALKRSYYQKVMCMKIFEVPIKSQYFTLLVVFIK